MIASLGMYDPPALQGANDRFWTAIRDALGFGPRALSRDRDLWDIWTDPALLFAQTCGYPYRARLHGRVQLIGTPDHRLEGCPPGHYRSVLVVRQDMQATRAEDLVAPRFAYNEALSQSGWAAPMTHLAGRVQISDYVQTGAHAASAAAVAEDRADLAALDALTWSILQRSDAPQTRALRVLETTTPTPALPYITAPRQTSGRDAARTAQAVTQAVSQAIDTLSAQDRADLHLHGLVQIPASAYLAIPTPPPPPAR